MTSEKPSAATGPNTSPSSPTTTTTTTTKKNKTPKSVTFSTNGVAAAAAKPRKSRRTTVRRKVDDDQLIPQKFGKFNPIRDLGYLLLFFAFMLYYAYDKRDVGKRAPKDKKLSLSGLKRMNEKMMEMMKAREEKRVHSYDCDLYYYESTIPESGMSIFAGKNYSKGEEIIDLGWPSIPLTTQVSDTTNNKDVIYLSPYTLLLKHHPKLANVQPSTEQQTQPPLWMTTENDQNEVSPKQPISLIATQNIQVGQELFLDYADHPQTAAPLRFQRIPTLQDYLQADELIRQERIEFQIVNKASTLKKNTNSNNKIKNQNIPKLKPITKQRAYEIEQGMRMTKKAVAMYDPTVAKILPTKAFSLKEYAFGDEGENSNTNITTQFMALTGTKSENIVKHKRLAAYGACLSKKRSSATTAVKEGEKVMTMPLYIRNAASLSSSCENDDDEVCSNNNFNSTESLRLTRSDSTLEIYPFDLGSIIEPASTPEQANVRYEWSETKILSTKAFDDSTKSLQVVTEKHFSDLAWDAIALRDIEAGEKLYVMLPRDYSTGQLSVPDELFPEKWRE